MFDKVIVIDEDSTSNLIFTKLANSIRFSKEVSTYISALDALDYLKDAVKTQERLPDAIFLDIKMPIMNGWEFMEEFTRNLPEAASQVPIFILSSSENENDFQRARQYKQIKKYLVKPLSIKTMRMLQESFV